MMTQLLINSPMVVNEFAEIIRRLSPIIGSSVIIACIAVNSLKDPLMNIAEEISMMVSMAPRDMVYLYSENTKLDLVACPKFISSDIERAVAIAKEFLMRDNYVRDLINSHCYGLCDFDVHGVNDGGAVPYIVLRIRTQ